MPNEIDMMTMIPPRPRLESALKRGCWGLIAVWSMASLWYPYGWDQGIFAWVGHTIVRGGMPYLDVFEIKGPLVYYPFALVEWALGRNTWGIRLSELLLLFAATYFVARAVEKYTDRPTARWASIVLILWFASLSFWHTAQPDGWAMMILALGFVPLLLDPEGPSVSATFGSGLAVGIAALMKPNYVVFLLVPTVRLVADRGQGSWFAVRRMGVAGLGAALPVAVVLAWFVHRGAFDALVEAHINYNVTVYATGGFLDLGSRAKGVLDYLLAGRLIPVLLAPAFLGVRELYRRDKPAMWTLTAWVLLAIGGVALQNKFFEYQWTPVFAPMIILAAIGMYSVLRPDNDGSSTRGSIVVLAQVLFLIALLHVTVRPLHDVTNWASYMIGARGPEEYHDTFGVPGPDYRMAQHIRGIARPDDKLVVVGWNAELLLLTNLDTVSRFHYSLPLWMGDGTADQERYRREFMDALLLQPPEFIVVAPQAEPLVGRVAALEEFSELYRFIAARYTRDVEIAGMELYRLLPGSATPSSGGL